MMHLDTAGFICYNFIKALITVDCIDAQCKMRVYFSSTVITIYAAIGASVTVAYSGK